MATITVVSAMSARRLRRRYLIVFEWRSSLGIVAFVLAVVVLVIVSSLRGGIFVFVPCVVVVAVALHIVSI